MWFNFCSDIVFFRGHDDKYRLVGPSSIVACDFLDSRTDVYDLAHSIRMDVVASSFIITMGLRMHREYMIE